MAGQYAAQRILWCARVALQLCHRKWQFDPAPTRPKPPQLESLTMSDLGRLEDLPADYVDLP